MKRNIASLLCSPSLLYLTSACFFTGFILLTEHFLDLVNADFSDDAEVDKILNMWEEKRPEAGSSHHAKVEEDSEQTGVSVLKRASVLTEMSIMFRRHAILIVRDPM
jgi:hypothetical protein